MNYRAAWQRRSGGSLNRANEAQPTRILVTALWVALAGTALAQEPPPVAVEQAQLDPPAGLQGDYGRSIAVSHATAVIGAPLDDEGGENAGAALVYLRTATGWDLQAKLIASDPSVGDNFGWSVDILGNTIVIGAPRHEEPGDPSWMDRGAAYVFVREGTVWSEQGKLAPAGLDWGYDFGFAVATYTDRAMIATSRCDSPCDGVNSIYVFHRSGETWTLEQTLQPVGVSMQDGFASQLSVSGPVLLAGAVGDDDAAFNGGAAYVFRRNGGVWSLEQKLTASDAASFDILGAGVSIDGDWIALGAPQASGAGPGKAYLFEWSGASWTETTRFAPSDGAAGDMFGIAIQVLNTGTLVVGAMMDDDNGSGSGSAYCYKEQGAEWEETTKFLASDGSNSDHFGSSLGLAGEKVVIGAPSAGSGMAYAYFPTEPFADFCSGDGSGTDCPCGNAGDPGHGCGNGTFPGGARLFASGSNGLLRGDLVLNASGVVPNAPGLFFQGNSPVNSGLGSTFGDGLRCAGGSVIRLQIVFTDGSGNSATSVDLGQKGGVSAGDTKRYQLWYRDPYASPCGSDFNLTNGYEVLWAP